MLQFTGSTACEVVGSRGDRLPRANRSRDFGLDVLRLLAMGIIALQHGLSVVGHYDWTVLTDGGISVGQFGVAIFCAVSGWFALAGRDPVGQWLFARLARIYPGYWLATLFAFCLAWLVDRQVTLGLFVSQMAGTGFFTHGWDLVNVVSWFISLILLCYLLAAVARSVTHGGAVMTACAIVAALLIAFEIEVALSRHVLAFSLAAVARFDGRPRLLIVLAVLIAPLLILQASFIYAIASLAALWLFREHLHGESRAVTIAVDYTYEFFLLHGIFLVGAARLIHSEPLAIAIGLACAVPAAVLLRFTTEWLSATALSLRVSDR